MLVASSDGNSSGLSDAATAFSSDVNSALVLCGLLLEEDMISASCGPYGFLAIWRGGGVVDG